MKLGNHFTCVIFLLYFYSCFIFLPENFMPEYRLIKEEIKTKRCCTIKGYFLAPFHKLDACSKRIFQLDKICIDIVQKVQLT